MHNDKIRRIGNTIFMAGAAFVALVLAMACSGEELISDLEPDQNQALYATDAEHQSALTAQEFKAKYCPGGYDFLYCWPDTSGNPWVQRTGTYFCGAVAATNCTIRCRFRYYDGGWKTFKDMKASPGQHYWFCRSGSQKAWRWEILDNENCGVRFSVWGKN